MDAGYYPIFLNWNSDVVDSYGEHLTRITQGQTDDSVVRRVLSPLYVLADVGRAVTRAPVVWSNQLGSDMSAAYTHMSAAPGGRSTGADQRWANTRQGQAIAARYNELRCAQEQEKATRPGDGARKNIRVYIGPDLDVDERHLAAGGFHYAITLPTKLATSWLIDGLGAPAWQNMSRRTLMAFDGQMGGNPTNPGPTEPPADAAADGPDDPAEQQQSEQQPQQLQQMQQQRVRQAPRERRPAERAANFTTTGALAVFREELLKVVTGRGVTEAAPSTAPVTSPGRAYEVTLIGHSMGTMVLNECLRRDLLDDRKPEYCHVVYMAAACSVRDFGRAVVPYLRQHRSTEFYNLMLHPLAELRERERFGDLPPRGSLLVWLDDFLADPQTPLDRTLGRWDNIVPATEIIPEAVRGQVTLKAFALAPYDDPTPPVRDGRRLPDYGPQAHGQFRGRAYWRPDFWYSEVPEIPPLDDAPATRAATPRDAAGE